MCETKGKKPQHHVFHCHTHYIWWLSVNVFDIKMLPATNPDIYQAFQELGCFVVWRTRNSFSSMGLDQRNEQQNKDVKGDGGFLGLTENEEELRRWMVCRILNLRQHVCLLKGKRKQNFATTKKLLAFRKGLYGV
jgi:hypothetical protein